MANVSPNLTPSLALPRQSCLRDVNLRAPAGKLLLDCLHCLPCWQQDKENREAKNIKQREIRNGVAGSMARSPFTVGPRLKSLPRSCLSGAWKAQPGPLLAGIHLQSHPMHGLGSAVSHFSLQERPSTEET